MKQHIRLIDIYHADLFSRSKAVELAGHINETAEEVVLDFQGIGFMSRSFADELYSITHLLSGVSFTYQGRNSFIWAHSPNNTTFTQESNTFFYSTSRNTYLHCYFSCCHLCIFLDCI